MSAYSDDPSRASAAVTWISVGGRKGARARGFELHDNAPRSSSGRA
jgi:hypothetical protein